MADNIRIFTSVMGDVLGCSLCFKDNSPYGLGKFVLSNKPLAESGYDKCPIPNCPSNKK